MRRFYKSKTFWVVAAVIVAIAAIVVYGKLSGNKSYAYKYADLDFEQLTAEGRSDTYTAYLARYHEAARPTEDVEVPLDESSVVEGDKYEFGPYGGVDKTLLAFEDGYVVLKVNVPTAGMYHIRLCYYPDQESVRSRGIEIERKILINGELPFAGADAIALPRVWQDERDPEDPSKPDIDVDTQGNQIRPKQVELPRWETVSLSDKDGYVVTPYCFYFKEGENTIRFDASQESLILKSLTLCAIEDLPKYANYIADADTSSAKNTFSQRVEGEMSTARSSQSLYSTYDRSSAGTYPYDVKHQVINMAGGTNWKIAGQWIEWEVEAPNDGFYELTLKTRQNYTRGLVSCRALYINGEIPFEEVSKIKFDFDNDWQVNTLSDEKGNPYLFHLKEGKNTIRLQVTLGRVGEILTEMTDAVYRLNQIYRRILVYTGTEPDPDRDYNIDDKYPDVIKGMKQESKVLYHIIDELVDYAGESGTQVSALLTLATQLERFVDDADKIPSGLAAFKNNVSSLGSSILTMKESNLDIDYLIVSGSDYKIPEDDVSWFDKVAHEVRSFLASFVVDYNAIGNVYEDDDMTTITVWIFQGRDQCTILKKMIDDTFVKEYHIGVNVNLMTAAVLLPATVAKTGPDVALNVASGEPVNYALRGASLDLTQFKGNTAQGGNIKSFEECFADFMPSSYVPYTYKYEDENGNMHEGVFGMPETQYYNLMFYRKDILDELGLTIPNTWDELIAMLPTIQKANMNVGIPSTERKINNVSNPDMNGFFAQLYQRGGKLYSDSGARVLLDEDISVEAFEYYTMFFTHYKTPTDYNFVDRFRTGEMPIGFVDFNTYNTLVVSAPEIRGLWDMAVLPGTIEKDENGNPKMDADGNPIINRSCGCWGTCSMILGTTEHPEESWAFLQWWGGEEAQATFGKELEAVMGESARYASANVKAFDHLAWSASQREMLEEQWRWVVGTPEVPGGYYTGRHIINAIRKVMNQNMDPRETVLDYTRDINDELIKKRKEFNLPTE
ncbi:MAG: extracellular solute-binding protein [Lachnospiraceae bacterium]|nr:extracellular solute-binding protein [Lachnospiraceae bacterium]